MEHYTFRYHGFAIALSDIVTAFGKDTIGTKVLDERKFMVYLADAMEKFDWSTCRQPGQAYISMPQETCTFVSAGIGKRSKDPEDYVVRVHRGEVGLYLRRHKWLTPLDMLGTDEPTTGSRLKSYTLAAPVDNVAVVIYTVDAYLKDPDCSPEEAARIASMAPSHVLVAVLASAGKPSTLTAHRFLHNLAGGNNEALAWTADEIRQKAKEIKEFTSEWAVVAD
jgi:hypothetical protein